MKLRNLITIFVITSILLVYSIICYHLLNDRIEIGTRSSIANYFSLNCPQVDSYEYLKAVGDSENTFQDFVKANDDEYTFRFRYENGEYQLVNATLGIPGYV